MTTRAEEELSSSSGLTAAGVMRLTELHAWVPGGHVCGRIVFNKDKILEMNSYSDLLPRCPVNSPLPDYNVCGGRRRRTLSK